MPDLSNVPKKDIMRFLASMPGAVSFGGWGGPSGTAQFTDDAALRTWQSAQKNPEYDAEVERAMYNSLQQLGPSAMQEYLRSVSGTMPKLRFMQEMSQGAIPRGTTPAALEGRK
jgi:hypothetical protein